MKALVRKELREHFRIAVIGLSVLSILLILAFSECTSSLERGDLIGYGNSESTQPLLAGNLLTQAGVFCALFGLLLGWLQIRAEKHPDLWAFLVHRPISRDSILRSKIVAGLLLYCLTTGIPMAGLIVVAATPGKVAAPFAWAMVLPLVAIALAGFGFYLAGLLTGMRAARWYGSRGFGLGPAVIAMMASFAVAEFWQAALFNVVVQIFLWLAVWGSFRTGGRYESQPALSKVALTAACTISVTLLLVLLMSGIAMLQSRARYNYSYYQLTKDGNVIKIIHHDTDEPTLLDLEGKPLVDETTGRRLLYKDLQRTGRYGPGISANVNAFRKERTRYWQFHRFFHPWSILDKTIWYLTTDGRLVAFHATTRKQIAVLTPPALAGEETGRFLPAPAYTYRGLGSHETITALPTSRSVYAVDLEKMEMKPLFSVGSDDVITGHAQMASQFSPASSNLVLVLSRTSVSLVNFEGQMLFQQPFEPAAPEYSMVSVNLFEAGPRYGLRFDPDAELNYKLGNTLPIHIKWLNSDGTVSRSMELPKLPPATRYDAPWEFASMVLSPPVIPIHLMAPAPRIAIYLQWGVALVCGVIAWWLGTRNNFSKGARVGWLVFNLFFGVPGLLAFLAVQEWPPKETCARCKRVRVMTQSACEHCGAQAAAPAPVGIEIFEPLEVK